MAYDTKISELYLSTRTKRILLNWFGKDTRVSEVFKAEDSQLAKIPRFGRKSFNELRQALNDLNINYVGTCVGFEYKPVDVSVKATTNGWIPIEHAPKDIWVLGWIVADTPAYTPRARMMAWDKEYWYIPHENKAYPTHYKLVDITPPNNKWSR